MGVVMLVNGGPGTVWGDRALAAYRELADGQRLNNRLAAVVPRVLDDETEQRGQHDDL
jgi:hypothetical protein